MRRRDWLQSKPWARIARLCRTEEVGLSSSRWLCLIVFVVGQVRDEVVFPAREGRRNLEDGDVRDGRGKWMERTGETGNQTRPKCQSAWRGTGWQRSEQDNQSPLECVEKSLCRSLHWFAGLQGATDGRGRTAGTTRKSPSRHVFIVTQVRKRLYMST
jgi:hypothetical protein